MLKKTYTTDVTIFYNIGNEKNKNSSLEIITYKGERK